MVQGGCSVRASLTTPTTALAAKAAQTVIGRSAAFTIGPGETRRIALHLSKRALRHRALRAVLRTVTTFASGLQARDARAVRLRR
jgi:hypothetical protein